MILSLIDFGEFTYLGPFVVLLLCGVGLPLPEEVTLIGSGILLYSGQVEFIPIVAVCSVAILLGDSIPYWLGRKYGLATLKNRWMARLLPPQRLEKFQERFEEHGNWATFACRFFAGVRIPGYFIAGSMGMRYARFLILDGIGVLLSVPISIYIGSLFGAQVDKLEERMGEFHQVLAFVVLALIGVLFLRSRRAKARARALAAKAEQARAMAQESGAAGPAAAQALAEEADGGLSAAERVERVDPLPPTTGPSRTLEGPPTGP